MILYQKRLSIYFKSMALLLLVTFAVPEATQSHFSFLAPTSPIQKTKSFLNKKELKQQFKEGNQALKQLIKTEVKTKEEFNQLITFIKKEYQKNKNFYYLTRSSYFLKKKAQKLLTDLSPVEEDSYWNKIFNLCINKNGEKKQETIKEEPKKIESLPKPQKKQEKIKTELDYFLEGFLESARLEFNALTATTRPTPETSVRLQREEFNGKDPKLPKYIKIIFNTNRPKERLFYLKQPSDKNMSHKKFGLVTSVAGNEKTRKMVVALNYQNQDSAISILFYKFNASKKGITEELLIDQKSSLTFKNSKGEEIPLTETNTARFYGKTVELNLPQLSQLLVEKSSVLSPFYEREAEEPSIKIAEELQRQSAATITLSAMAWPLLLPFLFMETNLAWFLAMIGVGYSLITQSDQETATAPNPTPLQNKIAPAAVIATAL